MDGRRVAPLQKKQVWKEPCVGCPLIQGTVDGAWQCHVREGAIVPMHRSFTRESFRESMVHNWTKLDQVSWRSEQNAIGQKASIGWRKMAGGGGGGGIGRRWGGGGGGDSLSQRTF